MKVIYDLDEQITSKDRAVALGFFDGVHLGHRAVLDKAVEYGEKGLCPCAFTFVMGNLNRPFKKQNSLAVQSEDEKLKCMEILGIEEVFCPEFSAFMDLSPKEFAENILINKFNAKVLCCGRDFRFGKNAEGNIDFLKSICEEHKIKLEIIDEVFYKGEPISSTRIRNAVSEGEMSEVKNMLGRYYSITAKVIHGNEIGRTMGFPTANQSIESLHSVPEFGVYATVVTLPDGKKYSGTTNVGVKPTVGSNEVLAETFIRDFEGSLYGLEIKTEFVEFLRREQKFDSVEELSEAIKEDLEKSRKIYSGI